MPHAQHANPAFHVEVTASTTPFYVLEQHVSHYLVAEGQHDVDGRSKPGLWTADQLLSNTNYFANFPFASVGGSVANHPLVREAVYAMKARSEKTTMRFNLRSQEWFREHFCTWFLPCSQNGGDSVLAGFDKARKASGTLAQEDAGARVLDALESIRAEAAGEIAFYEDLREQCRDDGPQTFRRNALACYRRLLPVWILRQEFCRAAAPNLYGLGLWECGAQDGSGVRWIRGSLLDCLLDDLAECLSYDADADAVEDYRTCVMGEYEEYRAAYAERDARAEKEQFACSVPQLHALFEKDGKPVPPWVRHKANLVWNLVVCPLFGVAHRLPAESADKTVTSSAPMSAGKDGGALGVGSGQVPVFQLKSQVCEESRQERTLDLRAASHADGLVMLFGSRYDRTYWDPLRTAVAKDVEGFFAWEDSPLRTLLREAADGFFTRSRMADIRRALGRDGGRGKGAGETEATGTPAGRRDADREASADDGRDTDADDGRDAGADAGKSADDGRDALVASLPGRLAETLDAHGRAYCKAHPRTLAKNAADPKHAGACPTVGAAVDAAQRDFCASLPPAVKVAEDLRQFLAAAVARFFEGELGATEQEGAAGVGWERSLLAGRVFARIDGFFGGEPAPSKRLLRKHMRTHLLEWRSKNRKAIDCDALLAAVGRAFDACIEEEQRLFCTTGPGNASGPLAGPVNSRRHFALAVEDGRLMMHDVGSHNGSFVIRSGNRPGVSGNAPAPDDAGAGAAQAGTVYVFEGRARAANALEAAQSLGYACMPVGKEGLRAYRGDVLVIGRYSRFQIG